MCWCCETAWFVNHARIGEFNILTTVPARMWQGIQHISNYRGNQQPTVAVQHWHHPCGGAEPLLCTLLNNREGHYSNTTTGGYRPPAEHTDRRGETSLQLSECEESWGPRRDPEESDKRLRPPTLAGIHRHLSFITVWSYCPPPARNQILLYLCLNRVTSLV